MTLKRPRALLLWLAIPVLLIGSVSMAQFAQGATTNAVLNLTQHVNTLIGTDAGGTTPAAALPFGMVQIGPDTPDHRYHYPDTIIQDFSTTHMSGAGCNNKGDVQFLPFVGAIGTSPGTNWNDYRSSYSHATESAVPGYYGVTLGGSGTKVELTATQRTGSARMTFPSSTESRILFNASQNNSYSDRGGQLSIVGDNQLTGVFNAGGTCSNQQVYLLHYTIVFDRPFTGFGTWLGGGVTAGSRETNGNKAGGYVTFDTTGNRTVQMKVALSYVSLTGAQQAMSAENNGWNFDAVRAAADSVWNTQLNSIQVAGGSADELKKFYSSLYHVFYTPNLSSDVNGDYIGFDNAAHNSSRPVYQNYSGWDVYRSWMPLVAMLAPQGSDIVQSMVLDGQQGGKSLPMWSDANKELRVMAGDPGTIMVSSAHAFQARQFDTAAALSVMDRSADNPDATVRGSLNEWKNLRFYPDNAATTLEYATADFAIAQFAGRLGDAALAGKYAPRGQYWKNTFNPDTGYIQGRRRDGTWMTPWTPTTTDGYNEGNGSVYTWMVPYNLKALFGLMGGEAAVIPRLDTFFSSVSGGTDKPVLDPGNEPSFSQPWIYNSVHQPWKTQEVIDRVVTQRFRAAPAGYPGDDDLGAMSSWLVWAYLGMYPSMPGTDVLTLATPRFPALTINTAGGRAIRISTSGTGRYVRSLSVNGSATSRSWLRYGDIADGTALDFQVGDSPNTVWGSQAGDEPPSFDAGSTPAGAK